MYLRDEQAIRLKRAAVRCGHSEAELIREGVELVLRSLGTERPEPSVFFDSGDPNWADRTDEVLAESFGSEGYE